MKHSYEGNNPVILYLVPLDNEVSLSICLIGTNGLNPMPLRIFESLQIFSALCLILLFP